MTLNHWVQGSSPCGRTIFLYCLNFCQSICKGKFGFPRTFNGLDGHYGLDGRRGRLVMTLCLGKTLLFPDKSTSFQLFLLFISPASCVCRFEFEDHVFVHFDLLAVCPDTEPSRERPAEQTTIISPSFYDLSFFCQDMRQEFFRTFSSLKSTKKLLLLNTPPIYSVDFFEIELLLS